MQAIIIKTLKSTQYFNFNPFSWIASITYRRIKKFVFCDSRHKWNPSIFSLTKQFCRVIREESRLAKILLNNWCPNYKRIACELS